MSRDSDLIAIDGPGPGIQDRAEVYKVPTGMILVVADGAGGSALGGQAADLVTLLLETFLEDGGPVDDEESWELFLHLVDSEIARRCPPGESTAVILASAPGWVRGASVGDSEAWLVHGDGWIDLTARQSRKPLLGSGQAEPVGFRHEGEGGVIVVGSDGLFKYAPHDLIRSIALDDSGNTTRRLIDRARMANGKLQDDVAVIVHRRPEV